MYIIDTIMVMKREEDRWSVAEARARFSELIRLAAERPQIILSRGRPVAALVHPGALDDLREISGASLDESLAELRSAARREDWILEVPDRADRESGFDIDR